MKSSGNEKHEDFETISKRDELIRSDRHEFDQVDSKLICEFGSYEVVNYSVSGLAISIPTKDQPAMTNESWVGDHEVDGVNVGRYAAKTVRRGKADENGLCIIALELSHGSVDIQKIKTVIQLREVLNNLSDTHQIINGLPETFRRLTMEARLFLQNMEARIESMRGERSLGSLEEIRTFEATLIPMVADYLTVFFKPAYVQLANSLKDVDKNTLPHCIEFFRDQLKDLIYQSPFANRSVSKPLGYAGDYEMMNIIYRNEYAGDSLFGKCLHTYWLNHPEAKAVRNRSRYLYEKLISVLQEFQGKKIRICSVACGPARELQMLIADSKGLDLSESEFQLLDQDLHALKHAQEQLRSIVRSSGSKIKLKYVNKAIKNVISRGLDDDDFDLIYSAGLFDYFSDPVAQMGAKALYNKLKPGGRLIIGNFNLTTPNQFTMRLALDWSLIYRSIEDLTRLFGDLGGTLNIEQEPEGVNLFCVITKKAI